MDSGGPAGGARVARLLRSVAELYIFSKLHSNVPRCNLVFQLTQPTAQPDTVKFSMPRTVRLGGRLDCCSDSPLNSA